MSEPTGVKSCAKCGQQVEDDGTNDSTTCPSCGEVIVSKNRRFSVRLFFALLPALLMIVVPAGVSGLFRDPDSRGFGNAFSAFALLALLTPVYLFFFEMKTGFGQNIENTQQKVDVAESIGIALIFTIVNYGVAFAGCVSATLLL